MRLTLKIGGRSTTGNSEGLKPSTEWKKYSRGAEIKKKVRTAISQEEEVEG